MNLMMRKEINPALKNLLPSSSFLISFSPSQPFPLIKPLLKLLIQLFVATLKVFSDVYKEIYIFVWNDNKFVLFDFSVSVSILID